ncbi:hypothetical protein TNCV_3814031 [Trichonephila clavipes]|nr:hypothetical protein TNCV_3814031 [Trichonephila clavipes]
MGRTNPVETVADEVRSLMRELPCKLQYDWSRPINAESGRGNRLGRSGNKRPGEVFDPFVDMTSSTDWSERTVDTEHQPPNSPSRVIAWRRPYRRMLRPYSERQSRQETFTRHGPVNLQNARPNDPMMQSYHQEVTKAGENVELLLVQLNVPLFRIPASEKS